MWWGDITGIRAVNYDTLQIFDPATGSWSLGANLPVKITRAAVVAYEGKLYVFGGGGASGILLKNYLCL